MTGSLTRAEEIARDEGLLALGKTAYEVKVKGPLVSKIWNSRPVDRFCWKRSVDRLHKRMSTEERDAIRDVLDTVYSYRGLGQYRQLYPAQHRGELLELAELVKEQRPRTVLEIGTDRGGTLYVWSRYLDSVRTIVSVDIDYSSIEHSHVEYANREEFLHRFETAAEITTVEANSQAVETAAGVERALDGNAIDFLFIDGDHTYDGVRRDFELYEPFVATDGMIAFHDIVPSPDNGVPEFWEELKGDYETLEISSTSEFDPGPHIPDRRYERLKTRTGVGVLFRG